MKQSTLTNCATGLFGAIAALNLGLGVALSNDDLKEYLRDKNRKAPPPAALFVKAGFAALAAFAIRGSAKNIAEQERKSLES